MRAKCIAVMLSTIVALPWVSGCGAAHAHQPSVDTSQTVGAPTRPITRDEVSGRASYYADRYHGRSTASGEPYDRTAYTAAHKTFPFGTVVRVTRLDTRKSVVVRINDRGPFTEGRVIDLSRASAQDLDLIERGVAEVEIEVLAWGNGRRTP